MHRFLNITALVLAVFLFSLSALVFVPCLFGLQPRIVLSGSMEPLIHTGSLCYIDTGYPYDELRTGDVIAFKVSGGAEVTHRITAVTGKGLITKGDANTSEDGLIVDRDKYLGKNVFNIPYAGVALTILQDRRFILAIALFIIFMVLADIYFFLKSKGGDRYAA